MSKIIGIDLGTANIRTAVVEGGQPVLIKDAAGNRSTPSLVSFTDSGERLTGREAGRLAAIGADQPVISVMRKLGTAETISAGGKEYCPERLCAMLLESVKETAESYLGEKVSQAVVSVPDFFSIRQRRAVVDAGRIAGLEVLRIISGTAAAAMACGFGKEESSKVLVYSLGGGSFSVSVVEAGDGIFEVLGTNGSLALGGDDFDRRIVSYAAEQFRKQSGTDLLQDRIALRRLKEAAERARIELSSANEAYISLPYIAAGPKHLDVTLTRTVFNALTADLVNATMELVHKTLKDTDLNADQIDRVILAGGCTRIPAVRDAVRMAVDKEPFGSVNPDECAVLGAAVQGGVLNGDIKNVLLLDVIPMSLGLETEGHVFSEVIDRNTLIPVSRTRIFSTEEDNQTTADIHVLQGGRPAAAENISLGRYRLSGVAPAPKGVPRIEVTFTVDSSGILNVSAGGGECRLTVTESMGLAESEIARYAAEEQIYLAKKSRLREEGEVLNRADSLIREAEKILQEYGATLSAEDSSMIRSETDAFRKVREGGNAAVVRSVMESFTGELYAVLGRLYRQQNK